MTEHPNTERANTRTGEHPLASFASWVVLFASFGLSAATWIALADLAGFHRSAPVPFTEHFRVQLTWLMPVAVDGYVVVALVLWMSPVPAKVAAFAKKNTYAAALIGVVAQSAFHCASVASATQSGWRAVMAAVVGAIPPAGAALSVHMRALIRRESGQVGASPITVRRVVIPSGLSIADQITTPIAAPNGQANIGTERAPIAEQSTRTDIEAIAPNTPDPIVPNMPAANTEQNTAEDPVTEQPDADAAIVRAITSARRTPNGKANGANTDTARNLERIKRKHRDWRTDMPSARTIAALLGVSASTGYSYQQKLIAERDAPNTQPTTDSADDKEREAVVSA